jgi:hypothetical protein
MVTGTPPPKKAKGANMMIFKILGGLLVEIIITAKANIQNRAKRWVSPDLTQP